MGEPLVFPVSFFCSFVALSEFLHLSLGYPRVRGHMVEVVVVLVVVDLAVVVVVVIVGVDLVVVVTVVVVIVDPYVAVMMDVVGSNQDDHYW